ncbi:MAG: rod shape-determining protein MreC, partial [Bacteroidales bacterium]|nr:rod shape-determining protein MreC [Bacteroidales bacterium]
DTIVTSGMANDFPEGIMVGYVDGLSTARGSGFYNVKVRLATEFTKLDHVYIINNRFKSEQDELMAVTQKSN